MPIAIPIAIAIAIARCHVMVTSFYLKGTKSAESHRLNLSLLKRINDLDFVISIKGSPYSAGGSSDF
jgi:hypothetical protein